METYSSATIKKVVALPVRRVQKAGVVIMICTGPVETHYGTEYHDPLEVEDKESCSSCLGIFNAEILHIQAVENYKVICKDFSDLMDRFDKQGDVDGI